MKTRRFASIRLCQAFQPGSNIHTIAVDIAFIENNVTQIDGDAVSDFSVVSDFRFTAHHFALD